MKKILILGTGTAGLIAASMIKESYGDKVDISVYYDKNQENIGVGEGTIPNIHNVLDTLGISVQDLIKSIGATIKLGINFKNWIPGKKYFHGFSEIVEPSDDVFFNETETTACYGIANGIYHGASLHNESTTKIPNSKFNYGYAIHLDTLKFSKYIRCVVKNKIKFVDDTLVDSVIENGFIKNLVFEKSGTVSADFYVDCSGFNSLLMGKLTNGWVDISDILPLDTAIPQQVPIGNRDINSNTLAEATSNGWIWQIPVGERYGTGYLYSSKFTSHEEAREDYSKWLKANHNVELESNRIIKYHPGYHKDFCIGNCVAIGLASGFVEPLEATGIGVIIEQVGSLIDYGILLNNLEFDRKIINKINRDLYESIIDFISFHYITGRTDSDFWRYMKDHKSEWAKDLEEKCRVDFIGYHHIKNTFWSIDSCIQVANGLEMFNPENVNQYMKNKVDSEYFIEKMKTEFYRQKEIKNNNMRTSISHREYLNTILSGIK